MGGVGTGKSYMATCIANVLLEQEKKVLMANFPTISNQIFASIEKNAYIVGCGHYSEIWSDVNYEAMVADEDLASMRDILESYGL